MVVQDKLHQVCDSQNNHTTLRVTAYLMHNFAFGNRNIKKYI